MNNSIEIAGLLKKVPLFARLSSGHLRAVANSCTERQFAAGDTIVQQGNPGIGLFIILAGSIKVESTTEDGSVYEVGTHGVGEAIGEIAVLDGAASKTSITAIEETKTLILPSWAFNAFLQTHPEVALEILPVVVQRYRDAASSLLQIDMEG